jgi:Protein phosphatase 2C
MPNNQMDPYNQGGQPRQDQPHEQQKQPFKMHRGQQQQPIILSNQGVQQEQQTQRAQLVPEAEAPGTQRRVEQRPGDDQIVSSVFGRTGRNGAAALQQQQVAGQREPFDRTDYILAIVVVVLIIAIIAVIIAFFASFHLSFSSPGDNLVRLFPYLLIYVFCVGAGILWGRYQLDTAAKKESARLSGVLMQQNDEIERLNSERGSLQRELFMKESELAAIKNTPPPVLPPPDRSPSYQYGKVVEPPKIDRIQPQQSIYDVTRDPPDFNEREQREHPHEKFYPERGKSWTMQSGWNIIGASRRGYGHAYEGKYREDDFEIRRFKVPAPGQPPTMIMVAIADGVSSKAYSRRGARAAVRGAVSITNTSTHLLNLATCIGTNTPFKTWQNAAFNALMESLSAAHDFVEQQGKEDRIPVDEMQSTLLVYLAVPLEQHMFIASVQVGDGALFALQPAKGATPGERWKWLQHPQIQVTGNEVQPFMRTGREMWQHYLQAEVLQNPTFIMGMTDGTADDIESPRPTAEVPHPDPFYFVDDFYQHIAKDVVTAPQPAEALLKFLDYRKKQSFDDRTVVCLYR